MGQPDHDSRLRASSALARLRRRASPGTVLAVTAWSIDRLAVSPFGQRQQKRSHRLEYVTRSGHGEDCVVDAFKLVTGASLCIRQWRLCVGSQAVAVCLPVDTSSEERSNTNTLPARDVKAVPELSRPVLHKLDIHGATPHVRPAPEIDYETTVPELVEVSLNAEDIFLLGETCGSEANEEVAGDADDCSNRDSGSVSVAQGMDDSSDEQDAIPTTRSFGLQTDESDTETTTTFSSFLCHMTRDRVATQVAHEAAESVLPATTSSPRKKSRPLYIRYIAH
ncbi:hypothetical protein MRX96_028692 [Rhipicephalus microplus]